MCAFMERMDIRLQLLVSKSFVQALDDWRRGLHDVPNRSEAIRRAVRMQIQNLTPREDGRRQEIARVKALRAKRSGSGRKK